MFKKLYIFLKNKINKIFRRDIKFLGNYNSWNEAKKNLLVMIAKQYLKKLKKVF